MSDQSARPLLTSRAGLLLGPFGIAFALVVACGSGVPFTSQPADGVGGNESNSQAGSDMVGGAAGGADGGSHGDAGGAGSQVGGTGGSDGSSLGGESGVQGGQASGGGGADAGAPTCAEECEDPVPYCADVNGTPTCTNPAQALSGKRIELPCLPGQDGVSALCQTVEDRTAQCPPGGKLSKQTVQITGASDALYSVTLRLRGVLEPRSYVGGKDAGDHFYIGGTGQQPSNYNTYSVVVSSPAQTFYLNSDSKPESYRVFTLDHQKAIVVAGGATVTLQVYDPDCAMVRNCQDADANVCSPYVVAGVPPAPLSYDGQFVQLDVVSVSPAN